MEGTEKKMTVRSQTYRRTNNAGKEILLSYGGRNGWKISQDGEISFRKGKFEEVKTYVDTL